MTVRVLCGQCRQVHDLDDDFREATAECAACGHIIPVPRFDSDQPPPPKTGEFLEIILGDEPEMGFAEQARSAGERKIPVTCPDCGKTVQVGARAAGKRARCKTCNHPLQIPWPDDLEEFKLPGPHRVDEASEAKLDVLAGSGKLAELARALEATAHALEATAQEATAPDAPVELLAQPLIIPGQEIPGQVPAPAQPEQAGELLTAVKGFRDSMAARRRRHMGRRGWRAVLLLAAVAAIGVPLAVVIPILRRPPQGDGGRGASAGTTQPGAGTRVAIGRPSPTTDRAGPATASETHPVPPTAACQVAVVAVDSQPFASGGYFAAPPGWTYWHVTADVTAGARPLRFSAAGGDVSLIAAQQRYPSLGTPDSGNGPIPIRASRGTIALEPGQARRVTFLFEVPQQTPGGRLSIQHQAEAAAAPPPAQGDPSPEALAGTYVELAPRNLKPLLADPVMAAIQAAPDQQLIIAPDAQGIRISLPQALVGGTAQRIGPGLFQAVLRRDEHVLKCALRVVDDGRRLVLYLADGPFHQLTFITTKPPPPPATASAPASGSPTAPATRPTRSRPASRPAGPDFGPGMFEETPSYDPNAKPKPGEKLKLPTGRSIFDP